MSRTSSQLVNSIFTNHNQRERIYLRRAYRIFRNYGDEWWARDLTLALVAGSRNLPG